jgi:hypothetical protein
MTRDQLISALMKFPGDMEVVVSLPQGEDNGPNKAGKPMLEQGWKYSKDGIAYVTDSFRPPEGKHSEVILL